MQDDLPALGIVDVDVTLDLAIGPYLQCLVMDSLAV